MESVEHTGAEILLLIKLSQEAHSRFYVTIEIAWSGAKDQVSVF
jgi:hypothetical protein